MTSHSDLPAKSNDNHRSIAGRIRSLRGAARRRLIPLIVLVVAVSGFFVAAYAFHLFTPQTNCWIRPTSAPNTAVFTIVMADEGMNVGFNGSKFHAAQQWPQMNVSVGQNVVIHVINNDTAQAHGFEIIQYFEQGLRLAPGMCYDVRFVANVPGSFLVFCQIFCTIHLTMQNGRLNVN